MMMVELWNSFCSIQQRLGSCALHTGVKLYLPVVQNPAALAMPCGSACCRPFGLRPPTERTISPTQYCFEQTKTRGAGPVPRSAIPHLSCSALPVPSCTQAERCVMLLLC